ncbi:MAG: cyclic nucleotide-binding domain-containing protein [Myxococcales bacterium]|nr:cyclic nucleotide-binding domain-containing protein [Myxococcales bacterium]
MTAPLLTLPPPRDDDHEDVAWALRAASAQWRRHARADAVSWVRRAAETAREVGQGPRAVELAALADHLANLPAPTRPPPPTAPPPRPPPTPSRRPSAAAPPPPPHVLGAVAPPPPGVFRPALPSLEIELDELEPDEIEPVSQSEVEEIDDIELIEDDILLEEEDVDELVEPPVPSTPPVVQVREGDSGSAALQAAMARASSPELSVEEVSLDDLDLEGLTDLSDAGVDAGDDGDGDAGFDESEAPTNVSSSPPFSRRDSSAAGAPEAVVPEAPLPQNPPPPFELQAESPELPSAFTLDGEEAATDVDAEPPPAALGAVPDLDEPLTDSDELTEPGHPPRSEGRPELAAPVAPASRPADRPTSRPARRPTSRPASRPVERPVSHAPSVPPQEPFPLAPSAQLPAVQERPSRSPRRPSTVAPAEVTEPVVDGVSLTTVRGLEDLPEDAQLELARVAELRNLAPGEEVNSFGVALVTQGTVELMPAVADASCAHARRGEVIFTRGTLADGVAVRVVGAAPGTRVAVWSDARLEAATTACPWVADELALIADRYQALAGAVMGPLGDSLDAMFRGMVLDKCGVRAFDPGAVLLEAGKPVDGMYILGVGRLELLDAEGRLLEEVGPGDFLFPETILAAGNASATVRAGAGGALVLYASRMEAHELLATCPPFIELLAG